MSTFLFLQMLINANEKDRKGLEMANESVEWAETLCAITSKDADFLRNDIKNCLTAIGY